MLKTRIIAALLACAAAATADTVILKNGEKVEGKILSKTAAEVTIEVKITASIKDERVIKIADVEKIEETPQDATAWAEIAPTLPVLGQDSLDAADYARATGRLKDFLTQFPQSAHAAEAKTKLAPIEEEKKRIDGGELKLAGKWLTKEQVQEDRVQIGGSKLLNLMKRHMNAGQLSDALNVFDAMEKNYAGSAAWPDAVEQARRAVPSLKLSAEQRLTQFKQQAAKNKARIEEAPANEKLQVQGIVRQQEELNNRAVLAIEGHNLKWMPLSPANEKSLGQIISKAGGEISRLAGPPIDKMRESLRAIDEAKSAFEKQDLATAEKKVAEALSAWNANQKIPALQLKVAEARKADLLAKTEAAKAEETRKAELAKATPTPKPKPAPAPVEPVAEEAPKEEEGSILTKPVFWVILILVGGLIALVMKFLNKFRDPTKNILDQ